MVYKLSYRGVVYEKDFKSFNLISPCVAIQRSKTTFKSSSKRHVCGKPSIHILSPCLVEMLDTADKVQLEVKYRLPPLCPSSRTRPRVIQVCGFLVDFINIIFEFSRFV